MKSACKFLFQRIALVSFAMAPLAHAVTAAPPLVEQVSVVSSGAMRTGMLAAARAGQRIVAVGDRGVVLLSDDEGKTFRQATSVPTRAMLTSVSFAPDGRTGWAAGHLGVVLMTRDAGTTWQLQRDDMSTDQPLFATLFVSAQEGYAAGLWSLFLRTHDAGRTWQVQVLDPAAKVGAERVAGPNLFALTRTLAGTLLMPSEQGVIYRSVDSGASWTAIHTDNTGTFWTSATLRSGTLLVAGLAGKLYRSTDDGQTWQALAPVTKSSITGITQLPNGRVVAVGLDGAMLSSRDDGLTFKAVYRPDRADLTAVLPVGSNSALVFSSTGPLPISQGFGSSSPIDVMAAY
jgi:photosystem II stability/assembly factor-like uncharacterized protein